jgi:hypothetical protein
MHERRASVRTRTDVRGSVLPFGEYETFDCDVLDLTNQGARLDIGRLGGRLGQRFDFSFDRFRTIRRCELIWQHGSFVGVVFIEENAN